MDEPATLLRLETLPHRLFFSTLPNGQLEFACFVCPHTDDSSRISIREMSWSITDTTSQTANLTGKRTITNEEHTSGRLFVSAILPAQWSDSVLRIEAWFDQQAAVGEWMITGYSQDNTFELPLAGQVLVLVGHRIGETHRSAWQLPAQQFAWDLLPLDHNGLRLLNTSLSESLQAPDFVGFGHPVIAPAAGRVARVVDGHPDGIRIGAYPEDVNYYLEHLERAAGNHVIIDHGEAIYSCLAHLRQDSITVDEGQIVEAGQMIGALGNSGFSSGPHLHLHFMDSLNLLPASPLPIRLQAEGRTYAPQAGDIIAS
jgi:hypothetical protein